MDVGEAAGVMLAWGAAVGFGGAGLARADGAGDLRQAAITQVETAGSSAGLVRACGVDPIAISAAVKDLLKRVPLGRPGPLLNSMFYLNTLPE